MRIVEERIEGLAAYASVPIAYEVRSRVDLAVLRASNGATIEEIPVEPWTKNYDDSPEDLPTALPGRFDVTNWLIVSAFDGDQRVGGMIVARDTAGCHMLEGRSDLASIFDARVHPSMRGRGVGAKLFEHVVTWARANGCTGLNVETQDVNVGACRFYRVMGCTLYSAEEGAYGPKYDEAKLIWHRPL